ncbi:TNF receptor-associated factor 5 isoform X1 [Hypomesus transpacificus]|uniref:TNF receptor-associated factor 5 isoform X1 n=2 Tax=Hypomesus transpacificus TaxID=137520 RepID=UPI001F07BCA3|nr:TNF receptor-associated factor 5 isoform X1 [Hypomesus transpacificus]XP_046900119.1 TNF receptor-associated factor 5 isoform X1 [Hypomesus transpacificus]XP_046900120.1 TNF receptor-associated factor 5 isoform X1 [Hypomesus transpacificus]XP_046900121.1 TNF receptor-associated factor 5 isoform X1 [Hypomesus transpacificus]XP_046900122.1 TNF receptor-associated factor 5 isoform X1 [Hypomesus transpacificus]
MTTEESDCCGLWELSRQNSGATGSWESDLGPVQHTLKFVKNLEEQYVCPVCKGVVFNPHQSGCGHIFCHHCIQGILEGSGMNPVCPLDGGLIKSNEVFQDNCCKREISNLEVYCTNSPNCSCRITLCRLQEHLKACQYELLQCSNTGCSEVMQRRDLQEHLRISCTHRMESCQHCKKPYMFCQLKDHEMTTCLEVEIECPNKCYQKIKRCKVTEHIDECPEVETDCVYAKFGCSVRDKRAEVRVHEETARNHHVLLVLESNTKLEKKMEVVQQEVLFRNQVLQENSQIVSSLEKEVRPLAQHVSRCDQTLTAVQRSLNEQRDQISSVRLQLQELSRMFSPGMAQEGLSYLKTSLDSLKQQVSTTEGLKDHLVALEENYKRHSRLLDIHTAQLERNEERFKELESTSYDGKLIWKIRDFRKKKSGVQGLQPCFCSVPFHTGRCGYKMAVKAYLNGDGDGKGSHLSLYVVLMRSDFDPLLQWPFRQTVSLSVLDQSGANNHYTHNLRPDPACNSFQRPSSDVAANVASGFPRFISHAQLEAPKTAVYIREDTLFVKVKVDTTGLDDL